MKRALAFATILLATALSPAAEAQKERKTPYWASISASEALMRTGPAKTYPAKWLYRRADLPIKVLEVYPSWRKVQDPDGETGWMLVNLLSDTRTGIVRGSEPRPLHEAANAGSPVRYLAQPGVVGRLNTCSGDWCEFEVGGRRGHIMKGHIWGVDAGEDF
ncbi:MAG: SH3 domain-containing protein [Pseudomonadota bacterium]|nr:SH3 domain-containing protein [Pseudomonadota bacterium]